MVLPIDEHLPAITGELRERRAVVVVADAGAGKSTRVPPAIAKSLLDDRKRVVVLQPRRVAAKAIASRMADEWSCELGREVGYHIRFEQKFTPISRVVVVTEGILLRMLQSDPFLTGVGAVILDEFHERSLNADLAVALLREVRRDVRPDLLIVVMSASLNADPICSYLDCQMVALPGRRFDVDTRYQGPACLAEDVGPRVGRAVTAAVAELDDADDQGHVLAFLPGAREIEQAAAVLRAAGTERAARILPLHGQLSLAAQTAALRPSSYRKVVLATNIAETSLTVEGLATVVDGGLERRMRYDPTRGFDRLETRRISAASALQRAGRVGRTRPGTAIRLWSESEHRSLEPSGVPEIRTASLAAAYLQVCAWSGRPPQTFDWFEAPEPGALEHARLELVSLGALTASGELSPHGKELLALPVEPRLGHLLLEGVRRDLVWEAGALAAWLSEGEPRLLREVLGHREADIVDLHGLRCLFNGVQLHELEPRLRVVVGRLRRIAAELADLVGGLPHGGASGAHWPDAAVSRLCLASFPDRVVRRRASGSPDVLLARGTAAVLTPGLAREWSGTWGIALDVGGDVWVRSGSAQVPRVHMLLPIDPSWIEQETFRLLRTEVTRCVEAERDTVVEVERTFLGELELAAHRRHAPTGPEASAELAAFLLKALDAKLAAHLPALRLRARWQWAERLGLSGIPPLGERWSRALTDACVGQVRGHRALEVLVNQLPWCVLDSAEQAYFGAMVPESVDLPSGRQVILGYPESIDAPTVSAVLQEFFGWLESPRIAGGRVPLKVELLAPNGRPVQVTSDLAYFWAHGYSDVRKDLRGRYPRHYWPENPMTASFRRAGRGRASTEP